MLHALTNPKSKFEQLPAASCQLPALIPMPYALDKQWYMFEAFNVDKSLVG